jgi:hypothetical protein
VGVSTTGALNCAAYPQITFLFTRAGVERVLGFVTTSAGSSWTAVPAVTTLQPGDLVTAQMSANGVGCTNEIPPVSFSAQYTANVSANLNNLGLGSISPCGFSASGAENPLKDCHFSTTHAALHALFSYKTIGWRSDGFLNRHSEMRRQEKPAPTAGFLTEAEKPGAY